MPNVIRSSRHFYFLNNKCKTQAISDFLDQFQPVVQQNIDFIWVNPLPWKTGKGEDRLLDVQNLILDCPANYDYNVVQFPSELAARAKAAAMTQALSIVKSKTEDVRKRQFALQKAIEENEELERNPNEKKRKKNLDKLQEKLVKAIQRLKKPELHDDFKAELCANNLVLERTKTGGHFEYWLKFQCLGTHEPFVIPIVFHKQDQKLLNRNFEIMSSFLVGKNYIEIRYEKTVEKRKTGETIGCDTGIKTVATFSHEENEIDRVSGLTYDDAVKRCARKRKGSRNFKQAIRTRDNIAKAIINRVSFDNVKIINLEDNSTLKYKKITERYRRHHAYGVIKNKIKQVAEELGVQVDMQTSNYKSQRCSLCGWTQSSNRKGKNFKCKNCGYKVDADYNASENNRRKLRWLDFGLISEQKLNRKGFYWEAEVGEEREVKPERFHLAVVPRLIFSG